MGPKQNNTNPKNQKMKGKFLIAIAVTLLAAALAYQHISWRGTWYVHYVSCPGSCCCPEREILFTSHNPLSTTKTSRSPAEPGEEITVTPLTGIWVLSTGHGPLPTSTVVTLTVSQLISTMCTMMSLLTSFPMIMPNMSPLNTNITTPNVPLSSSLE